MYVESRMLGPGDGECVDPDAVRKALLLSTEDRCALAVPELLVPFLMFFLQS